MGSHSGKRFKGVQRRGQKWYLSANSEELTVWGRGLVLLSWKSYKHSKVSSAHVNLCSGTLVPTFAQNELWCHGGCPGGTLLLFLILSETFQGWIRGCIVSSVHIYRLLVLPLLGFLFSPSSAGLREDLLILFVFLPSSVKLGNYTSGLPKTNFRSSEISKGWSAMLYTKIKILVI